MIGELLALDFDGVLCDGRAEYLESSWRVYCDIWEGSEVDLEALRPRFYDLRSVIETGWEMPLLLRSLQEGISDEAVLEDWSSIVRQLLEKYRLTAKGMSQLLDAKRDRWLESNQEDWLAHHQFYPGVIASIQKILNQSSTLIYIITTKEGRFARKLLEQQGIEFPTDQIIGKEAKQSKAKTLIRLQQQHHLSNIWFVEDRLKTLLSVATTTELQSVKLFLATWGYNTARSRQIAQDHPQIQSLSLEQFQQDFSQW